MGIRVGVSGENMRQRKTNTKSHVKSDSISDAVTLSYQLRKGRELLDVQIAHIQNVIAGLELHGHNNQ